MNNKQGKILPGLEKPTGVLGDIKLFGMLDKEFGTGKEWGDPVNG